MNREQRIAVLISNIFREQPDHFEDTAQEVAFTIECVICYIQSQLDEVPARGQFNLLDRVNKEHYNLLIDVALWYNETTLTQDEAIKYWYDKCKELASEEADSNCAWDENHLPLNECECNRCIERRQENEITKAEYWRGL